MKKNLLILLSSFFMMTFFAPVSRAQIREIAVPALNDVAIASLDMYGPVIYYNPQVVQQSGPLVASFIKMHEYGHHNLGHIVNRVFNANNPYLQAWLNVTMENAADAYATQYWIQQNRKDIIQAGANQMYISNNAGDATHPPSQVRANNIATLYFQITRTPLFP